MSFPIRFVVCTYNIWAGNRWPERENALTRFLELHIPDILCVQEERTVGNDNTVRYKGLVLQIPEDRHRHHYVKAKVRVHEYPGGHLAVFHGPRRLAVYNADGTSKEESEKQAA